MAFTNKGFTLVEGLLIIIILLVIGGAGYYVYSNQNTDGDDKSALTNTTESNNSAEIINDSGQKSYHDDMAKYSLQYPSIWSLSNSTEDSGHGDGSKVSQVTLTADTGLTLKLDHNFGGKGGDCQPAEGDTLHDLNNTCPSSEIIYSKKLNASVLNINSKAEANSAERFQDYDLYLVRIKFTSTKPDAKTIYYSGIMQDSPFYKVTSIKPSMGFNVPYSVLSNFSIPSVEAGYSINITMEPEGDSEAYFDREDVRQAEEMLSSLKFD